MSSLSIFFLGIATPSYRLITGDLHIHLLTYSMFAQWGPSSAPQKANDCLLLYFPEGRSKVTDFFGKSQVVKWVVNHSFRNFVNGKFKKLTLVND